MKGYTVVISMEVGNDGDTEKVLHEVKAETHEEAKAKALKELQTVAEKKTYKANGENLFAASNGEFTYFASIWED